MVYEHFYRTGNSRIVLLVVGDSARSWVLKGTKLDIDEDTMYDAITRVVEHAHIRFTGHLTPEDLDFSVDAKPPLTIWRISPEGNLMYTTKRLDSEDWPEHLSITRVPLESDSLSVSDKEKLAKVLADSTSGAANGFRFVVRVKTDSLFTAESDETLAPVDGGGKSRMYRTITIDQLNSYVVEVAAEEQTPASVIDVMRAAAKTFKRHEQYSELIGAAVDDQNRQRFLRARFEAQRAVELYPDSGWSYFERAGAETNLGDFSGGIRDLNKSIALGHKVWNDETLRAICDEQLGNFGATDSDYDAIFAKHDVLSYFEAARFRFSQGRYIDAKAALNAYFSETDEQYGRIWRYFIEWKADGKSSATDHLREYRDGHPIVNTRFSGILIHYLLGEISEDDLFKSAQTVRNQSVVDNLCEANFYAGMNHLLGGSPEKTKEYWDKTIATHVTNFIEYRYAKAHMPR
jgi:lipoprotein NlpI